MPEIDSIKLQRDRFLAFAFASADLLIEADGNGKILYSTGAAQKLTGQAEKQLVTQKWTDLIATYDRGAVIALEGTATPGLRCGPILIDLLNADKTDGTLKAVMAAIKMPGSNRLYVTLTEGSVIGAQLSQINRDNKEHELLDKNTFAKAAKETLQMAQSLGQDADLTLIDLGDYTELQSNMSEKEWADLKKGMNNVVRSRSIDGQTAAEVSDGKYSLIHERSFNTDVLTDQLSKLSSDLDPTGTGLTIETKTVTAELENLTDREFTRSIIFTLNEFEKNGTDLTIDTLNHGFKAYVTANAHKIGRFKSIIEQLQFSLHFQPIVDLKTGELKHFEMLCRFPDGKSPFEWIVFGEDVGLAPEFDLAVCERALKYIEHKGNPQHHHFAMNVSGMSIQDDDFFKKLIIKLDEHPKAAKYMMFEITESSEIDHLDKVGHAIQILRDKGHKISLDDFGAGAASFQYLHKLNVDYVKIDGQYTNNIEKNDRDKKLLSGLVKICADLDIITVSEMIETEDQADALLALGVNYGQGYVFAKPGPQPDYKLPTWAKKRAKRLAS